MEPPLAAHPRAVGSETPTRAKATSAGARSHLTTSASWRNRTERFFRTLPSDSLPRSACCRLGALVSALGANVLNRSEEPKPFTWIECSASEIRSTSRTRPIGVGCVALAHRISGFASLVRLAHAAYRTREAPRISGALYSRGRQLGQGHPRMERLDNCGSS